MSYWAEHSPEYYDDQFHRLGLYHDRTHQALICLHCQYALTCNHQQVRNHLWEKHQIPKERRWRILHFIHLLKLPDPNHLPVLEDQSPPHPHLRIQKGVICQHCTFRSLSEKLVLHHVKQQHLQGRIHASVIHHHLQRRVSLQSWTLQGVRKYWIVHDSSSRFLDPFSPDPAGTIRREALLPIDQQQHQQQLQLQRITASEQQYLQSTRAPQAAPDFTQTGFTGLAFTSNWMRRTQWAKIYHGRPRDILRRLTLPPLSSSDPFSLGQHEGQLLSSSITVEHRLRWIDHAMAQFFRQCEATVAQTDISIRTWLRNQTPLQTVFHPFELPYHASTRRRYYTWWKRLLFFIFRLWHLPFALQEQLYPSGFSADIHLMIEAIWEHAIWSQQLFQASASPSHRSNDLSSMSEAGSESDSDSDPGSDPEPTLVEEARSTVETDLPTLERSPVHPDLQYLADLVGKLSYLLCTEAYRNGQASSSLIIWYSGILGMSPDASTFLRPSLYTSHLSGLIYCIRLVILERCLPIHAHPSIEWPVRPSQHQLTILNEQRLHYLCLGSQTPASELFSLRSYGRVLQRSDGPAFRVFWSDDQQQLSWEDGTITMPQFRHLADTTFQQARQLTAELMCQG